MNPSTTFPDTNSQILKNVLLEDKKRHGKDKIWIVKFTTNRAIRRANRLADGSMPAPVPVVYEINEFATKRQLEALKKYARNNTIHFDMPDFDERMKEISISQK